MHRCEDEEGGGDNGGAGQKGGAGGGGGDGSRPADGAEFEYELLAIISCVFGGDESDWKEGEAEDGRHLITHVRVSPVDAAASGETVNAVIYYSY